MKSVFSLALLMVFLLANAQFRPKSKQQNMADVDNQTFSYGFYIGANYFDYKLHPTGDGLNDNELFLVEVKPQSGFHAGFIAKWKLSNYFDFRFEPGMYFLKRDLFFHNVASHIGTVTTSGQVITPDDIQRTVKSTYLDLPGFISLHGERWQNTRPYAQFGLSWMINLQSQEKNLEDNLDGVFRTKTHNFTYQIEMGVDVYFRRFKLTPAVKGIFFFNNEWFPDNEGTPPYWAGALTSLSTRAFVFSLKFQ